MKKFFSTFILFILLNTLITPIKVYSIDNKNILTTSSVTLKSDERKLWIDHVLWTRNFIISDLSSLPDEDFILQRLLKNQDDIGNSISPYYGEEAGNKLSELLREHISIASQVVDAAKNNKKAELDKYNTLWYKNADEIADFLSKANPNLQNTELKNMLHRHLELVTDQAVARINKLWPADIEAYDTGENHMIHFSDIISDAIIKQFPEKFR